MAGAAIPSHTVIKFQAKRSTRRAVVFQARRLRLIALRPVPALIQPSIIAGDRAANILYLHTDLQPASRAFSHTTCFFRQSETFRWQDTSRSQSRSEASKQERGETRRSVPLPALAIWAAAGLFRQVARNRDEPSLQGDSISPGMIQLQTGKNSDSRVRCVRL